MGGFNNICLLRCCTEFKSCNSANLSNIISLTECNFCNLSIKDYVWKFVSLICCNKGQVYGARSYLHSKNAKRCIFDQQMWTHIFLFMTGLYALHRNFLEMFIMVGITTPLSCFYHYEYERPGLIATAEGISAKLLFLYAIIQLLYAPTWHTLLFELFFFFATVVVFLGTNLRMDFYEQWHCLMHIVPAFWGIAIVLFHQPIISPHLYINFY